MAGIELSSFLKLADTNPLFLVEDKYVRGGCRVVADIAARDELLTKTYHLKAGMLVITQSDSKIWQLDPGLTSWTEFVGGGGVLPTRQTIEYTTETLVPGGYEDFNAEMGKSVTLFNVTINQGYSQLQGFATSTRSETNPYSFVAVPTHLTDDGTTTLTDGTVIAGRRYTILSNLDPIPNNMIYWRITNTGVTSDQFTIQITYLQME